MVDNGALPDQSVTTYLTSLSQKIVMHNEEINAKSTRPAAAASRSVFERFPVCFIRHTMASCLFNALQRLFPWRQLLLDSDPEALYVVGARSYSLSIGHYIVYKQFHNERPIDAVSRSNLVFIATPPPLYYVPNSGLELLLEELITSLKQLTDTSRFQTVSSVLFECTEFPLVLIELVLQYCFCIQLR